MQYAKDYTLTRQLKQQNLAEALPQGSDDDDDDDDDDAEDEIQRLAIRSWLTY